MYILKWEEVYQLARDYYDKYGNLEVSYNYCILYKDFSICLGAWIKKQKQLKRQNKLSDLQIKLLEEIGIVWKTEKIKDNKKELAWNEKYELAKQFYKEYGHLNIPQTYIINLDNNLINLGTWLIKQRELKRANKLSDTQIKLLEDLNVIWNPYNDYFEKRKTKYEKIWIRNYEIAKKYFEKYGNLLIAAQHLEYVDGQRILIGGWIASQREKYKLNKLTDEQIKLLEEIGMVWDAKGYRKLEKFLLEQYNLYERGLLNDDEVNKLLADGTFIYSDSDEIQKTDTLKLYRMITKDRIMVGDFCDI